MEIFACVLCLLNGAALGAAAHAMMCRRPAAPKAVDKHEQEQLAKYMAQWDALINYSGPGGVADD